MREQIPEVAEWLVAVLEIELRGGIDDFSAAWDEVREALESARIDFPDGASMHRPCPIS